MRIKLVFPGVPQAVQSMRVANIGGFIRKFQPKAQTDWKNYIRLSAQQQLPDGFKQFEGPVRLVSALFVFPPLKSWSKRKQAKLAAGGILLKTSTPDVCDNLLKGVIDATCRKGGPVMIDDSQICEVGHTRKIYGASPRTELVFEEIEVDEDGFMIENLF